jgi:hypothetical protein
MGAETEKTNHARTRVPRTWNQRAAAHFQKMHWKRFRNGRHNYIETHFSHGTAKKKHNTNRLRKQEREHFCKLIMEVHRRSSVNNLASEVTSFYCNNCLIPLDVNNKNRTTTSKICLVLHRDDKQGPIFPGNKSVCKFRLPAKCQMQPSLWGKKAYASSTKLRYLSRLLCKLSPYFELHHTWSHLSKLQRTTKPKKPTIVDLSSQIGLNWST